ncbi:MAG: GDP-mannose 4,6-dehydratase [Candidatus Andersenbacteria bacterium]
MKKILITGGAGFIGSHLTELLLTQGHEVYIIDDLSTGSLDNLTHLVDNDHLHITNGRVQNQKILAPLMAGVDEVFHLAASVGVRNIMENLVSSIENNIAGTAAVLEEADKHKIKVLLTSTSEVYGKGTGASSAETDDLRMGETIKTRWSYACSKAMDEYLAFSFYHERGLPVTVARLFNTVGERQSSAYGMVIPRFVDQALKNEPITVYGDGAQSRCFGHVKDVVGALVKLMDHSEAVGQVYNIGNTEEISIKELAEIVVKITGSRSEIVYIPYEKAFKTGFEDAESRRPNIDKIQKLIGYAPTYDIEAIVSAVVAHTRAEEQVAVGV